MKIDSKGHTLIEYATKLHTDPWLLHALIAIAKRSNSPVVRYSAVALDENGEIAGVGYSKMAETNAEKRWGDEHNPPRLHAEMGALCDAENKGHDVSKLKLYILPLSPADNPAQPAGYIMLRDLEHKPCFSCSSCGPKLKNLGIEVNVFNGLRGWETISPEQAKLDGERLAKLEKETGRRCRGVSIPGSVYKEPSLDVPGYLYIPALLSDMDEISLTISPQQKQCYEKASKENGLPSILKSVVDIKIGRSRGDIELS